MRNALTELVCMVFKESDTADKVLNDLRAVEKEYILDMELSVLVVRDTDGKVHVRQSADPAAPEAWPGDAPLALLKTLFGALFSNSLAGLFVGAAGSIGFAALSGTLAVYGIDYQFIKSLASTLELGSSAIFVLVRKTNARKLLSRLSKYQGTILRRSLTNEQEEKLRVVLLGRVS
ncbi:MAG: DUF1269 domain-containing protein [Phycisphaerales bacterium]|nr:MAG: DUF1269 domain-containing protein [Phycisphaerales bacterium]